MILLLEAHSHARDLLERSLSHHGKVCAPDLAHTTSLGDLIADVLREGRCDLLVLGDDLPGASPVSLIRLLRAYLPSLPVVVMRRQGATFPPLPRVIAVPYPDYETQLAPMVEFLLEDEADERISTSLRQAPTLAHSPTLLRMNAG